MILHLVLCNILWSMARFGDGNYHSFLYQSTGSVSFLEYTVFDYDLLSIYSHINYNIIKYGGYKTFEPPCIFLPFQLLRSFHVSEFNFYISNSVDLCLFQNFYISGSTFSAFYRISTLSSHFHLFYICISSDFQIVQKLMYSVLALQS